MRTIAKRIANAAQSTVAVRSGVDLVQDDFIRQGQGEIVDDSAIAVQQV
jgi:hypothetical protein